MSDRYIPSFADDAARFRQRFERRLRREQGDAQLRDLHLKQVTQRNDLSKSIDSSFRALV